MSAPRKTFKATIVRDGRNGSTCFIPLPFDPTPVFGKLRAAVVVTVGGHSYRSTIASMGDGPCLPLRRSNREAAGLEGGETVEVTLTGDADRKVEAPKDLVKALRAAPGALARWARRIEKAVAMVEVAQLSGGRPKPGRG